MAEGRVAAVRVAAVGAPPSVGEVAGACTHGLVGTPVISFAVVLVWMPGRATVASCVHLLDIVTVVIDVFLLGLVSG